MKPRPWLISGSITALLLATVATGSTAQADPAGQSLETLTPAEIAQAVTVTLITGDTVLVSPSGRLAFLPAEGREDVGYVTYTERSGGSADQYVIPRDALPLLTGGTLDDRLFNVSGLVRDGHAGADSLSVIVQDRGDSVSASSLDGATITQDLESIDAQAVDVSTEDASEFWADLLPGAGASALASGFTKVWLDGKVQALLDESVPQVGAPDAWDAGYSGSGVTTAVLDTGYDPAHPDLAGRVTGAKDFTDTSPDAIDGHGHGTHVASTVAGTGAASSGRYKGMAPESSLLIGKVLDDGGRGSESDIIAGMQWAADQGAAAVNMSLGGGPTDGTDPMDLAVNEITKATGTLFVIAAGNDGCALCVSSPASADAALSVGSVTKSDELSEFSSQGPRLGDYAVKPDITAPGSDITAAKAAGTQMGDPAGDLHTTASGTSMATPHVTGAVAILKQAHPDWTAEQLKAALMGAGKGLGDLSVYQQGAGRLDVSAAVSTVVTPSVGSLSFGNFAHPHDQPAESKTVTYTNTSDVDLTLDLALTDGNPGLFTVDKDSVVVPAGGTAEVIVTVDPSAGDTLGAQSAVLTASGGGSVVRTAVGANLEPKLFDITIDATARDGSELDVVFGAWFELEHGEGDFFDATGDHTLRLPAGRYELYGFVAGEKAASTEVTSFATDVIVTDADVTVAWDAGKGKRDSMNLDPKDEKFAVGIVNLSAVSLDDSFYRSVGWFLDETTKAYTVPSATMLGHDFTYLLQAQHVSPDGAAKPYQYNVSLPTTGKIPAGTTHVVRNSELHRDNEVFHSQGKSTTGYRLDVDWDHGGVAQVMEQSVPGTMTSYYTPGTWKGELYIGDFDTGDVEIAETYATKTKGTTSTEVWNKAPLNITPYGLREGEEIFVGGAMFDDSNGDITSYSQLLSGMTGTTSLSLDGEEIAATDVPCELSAALPAGAAGTATLTCTGARTVDWAAIGTQASAQWTFAATAVPPGESVDLPLNHVRLDAVNVVNGYAPAKARQNVTLDVGGYGDGYAGTKKLAFEVSYDDGKTWQKVVVHRTGDHATASLKHPAGATFVSVRLSSTDTAGNTVTQTTIRAYGLK